jgi:hypothetical protein
VYQMVEIFAQFSRGHSTQLMPQLKYCVLPIFSSGRHQEAGWLHFPYLIRLQPTLKSWLTRLLTFGVKTTEDKDIPR